MKTTVEIPDVLFRKAKAAAAERGVPLKDLFTQAVREHLHRGAGDSSRDKPSAPTWMNAFGGLRSLHKEPNGSIASWNRSSGRLKGDERR